MAVMLKCGECGAPNPLRRDTCYKCRNPLTVRLAVKCEQEIMIEVVYQRRRRVYTGRFETSFRPQRGRYRGDTRCPVCGSPLSIFYDIPPGKHSTAGTKALTVLGVLLGVWVLVSLVSGLIKAASDPVMLAIVPLVILPQAVIAALPWFVLHMLRLKQVFPAIRIRETDERDPSRVPPLEEDEKGCLPHWTVRHSGTIVNT